MRKQFAIALGLLAGCVSPAIAAPSLSMVLTVDTAQINILKGGPRWLSVDATGTVGQIGWTNGQLVRMLPVDPKAVPKDGIYTLKFMGTPPSGMAPQTVTPIAAKYRWPGQYPADLKGIRINASTNCMIVLLSSTPKASIDPGTCKFAP